MFENIMQDLSSGKVDIVATALTRTEERLEITNASVEIYPNYEEMAFAVFYTSKDNPNLTKAIDNVIIEIQLDGIVDEILEKYDTKRY